MKVLLICALIAAVAANPPQYKPAVYKAEPEPEYAPAPPAYRAPAAYKPAYPKNVDYEEEPRPIAPYEFAYAVNDEYDNHGRKEVSDGKSVSGSYHVDLPDGRRQTVNYRVDPLSGFVADVKFEGEAKYPEDEPGYVAPKEYKPAFHAYDTKSYKVAPKAPAYPKYAPAYTPEPAYDAPQYAPVYSKAPEY